MAIRYAATVNVPGYLPMDDDPPRFETARAAWQYHSDELERTGDAWVPDDPDDPDGPASKSQAALCIEHNAEDRPGPWVCANGAEHRPDSVGTVYGSTPDYDGDHDLGLAYCVTEVDADDDED